MLQCNEEQVWRATTTLKKQQQGGQGGRKRNSMGYRAQEACFTNVSPTCNP